MINHYTLHGFRTSTITLFKGKPYDRFKDLHKLKPLTDFDVHLTTSLGGVASTVFSCWFTTPLRDEVRLTTNLSRASVHVDLHNNQSVFLEME